MRKRPYTALIMLLLLSLWSVTAAASNGLAFGQVKLGMPPEAIKSIEMKAGSELLSSWDDKKGTLILEFTGNIAGFKAYSTYDFRPPKGVASDFTLHRTTVSIKRTDMERKKFEKLYNDLSEHLTKLYGRPTRALTPGGLVQFGREWKTPGTDIQIMFSHKSGEDFVILTKNTPIY